MQYFRVDNAPEKLKSNEMVVYKPNFLEDIQQNRKKRGVNSVATISNLRDTFMVITGKYDNTINPYHLKLTKYDNLVYEGDIGYSEIILKVIRDNGLDLINKVIEKQLLSRKPIIDTVYYVSPDLEGSAAFISLGFSMGDAKNTSKSASKNKDVV